MSNQGATAAILIGVWGTFALDVFSTLNSSPQTTELFAGEREDSLMHWVVIGSGVAGAGGTAGSAVSGSPFPLLAAGAVTLGMYLLYIHALKRGQGQTPPGQSVAY